TWVWRVRWARQRTAASWPKDTPPRLILGLAIQGGILVASLALMVFSLWYSHQETFAWTDTTRVAVAVSWIFVALTLGVLLFFNSGARNALHIVMDIINHFHRPKEDFPTRRHIEQRFAAVLNRLLVDENPTHLAVIAHSQGTVIALDVLASPW